MPLCHIFSDFEHFRIFFSCFITPSKDLSSVIKLHSIADKLLLLFPFEWDNATVRVLFRVLPSWGKFCLL